MRVSLEAIGLTSLFGLPWVLKFLWGPQIDQYGTKRRWMLTMQFLLVVMVIAVALLSPLPQGIRIIAILFFIGSFVAATHDMAIDGYYMEALDRKGQAKFVGYRVMAYRISMMTGTGVIVTIGATTDWLVAFLAAGALLSILFIYHLFLLPEIRNFFRAFLKLRLIIVIVSVAFIIIVLRSIFALEWYQQLNYHLPILDRIP
jgi:PAT family beta-lactamase induction signal transducer AmpG